MATEPLLAQRLLSYEQEMTHAPPAGVERRQHPRFELMAQVRVKRGQVDYVAELSNISLSGALLHLGTLKPPRWLDIGRIVEIGIIHPIDLEPVAAQGKVVRISQDESDTSVAVSFVELTEDDERGIGRLVVLARQRQPPRPETAGKPPPLPG